MERFSEIMTVGVVFSMIGVAVVFVENEARYHDVFHFFSVMGGSLIGIAIWRIRRQGRVEMD